MCLQGQVGDSVLGDKETPDEGSNLTSNSLPVGSSIVFIIHLYKHFHDFSVKVQIRQVRKRLCWL